MSQIVGLKGACDLMARQRPVWCGIRVKGSVLAVAALAMALGGCGGDLGASRQGLPAPHSLQDDPVPVVALGTVGEREFHRLVAEVVGYYQNDIDAEGAVLRLNADWASDQFGAKSAKNAGMWLLMTFGGTVRVPEATADGFTAILCHEMGHFFGGEPFLREGISAEAQADFYASSECLPRVWAQSQNAPAPSTPQDPALSANMEQRCASSSSSSEEAALCARNFRAGWTALNMSAARKNLPAPLDTTPDPSTATVTITTYPSLQCRLDTWIAGTTGAERPRCWYNPGL